MKEVTKDEFFKIINEKKLNVHPYPVGEYPYTEYFNFPDNTTLGIVRPVRELNSYPYFVRHYYIS